MFVKPTRVPIDFGALHFNYQERPKFDALLAYQNFDLSLCAKAIYDKVRWRLPENCESDLKLWSFDVLQIGKLCKAAAREAAVADMVIIATHECDQWPRGVEDWLELWQWRMASKGSALVGVVAKDPNQLEEESKVLTRLQAIATRTGMEFFFQTLCLPGSRVEAVSSSISLASKYEFSPITGYRQGRG
jgi:hypothetical protein